MADDAAARLRERNLRVTPQRRAILAAFDGSATEHLSADEVLARATRAVPEVSRGTVYATLAELAELGLLASVGTAEPVRYETNVDPHSHFRCRLCLRTFDVEVGVPDTTGLARKGFDVERVDVLAEGICADCRDFDRGLKDGMDSTADIAQLATSTVDGLTCRRHESPLGPMIVAASPDGIVRVAFEGGADFAPLEAGIPRRTGKSRARTRVDHATEALIAFFDGDKHAADDVVDWSLAGTANHPVLEALRDIPYAEHRSYLDVKGAVSAYDTGFALGVNPMPVLLPCHRIALGTTPSRSYVGGEQRLRQLNEFEANMNLA